MLRKVVIGSRGSDLALWQANFTKNQLESEGHAVEIKIIKTKGDQIQHLSFDKIEGKGFFTKELEDALLEKTIDLAVHSHKDLPTTFPKGLTIAGVSYREDCSESLLISPSAFDKMEVLGVKKGGIVGTSSARRKSQLLSLRPDLTIIELRGNVPTRIKKLIDGNYDAIVLASAGLNRLNLDLGELQRKVISPTILIPAPAQGVLAYQIREEDIEMKQIIAKLNDEEVAKSIEIERKVLNKMEGGCLLPLGVYCKFENEKFKVWSSLFTTPENKFKRVYLESKNADEAVNKILNCFSLQKNKTVYISRNKSEAQLFINQLEPFGYEIISEATIEFEALNVDSVPFTDWIFFSSKTGVEFFFSLEIPYSGVSKFAAIGSATSKALIEKNIVPHFIGDDSNIKKIAHDFSMVCKGTSVIFPGAKNGNKSIQQEIGQLIKAHDLVIYNTISKTISHDIKADIHVFTSPSSVKSFFKQVKNKVKIAVAIGETTANALKETEAEAVYVSPFTTEQSLADLVAGL